MLYPLSYGGLCAAPWLNSKPSPPTLGCVARLGTPEGGLGQIGFGGLLTFVLAYRLQNDGC